MIYIISIICILYLVCCFYILQICEAYKREERIKNQLQLVQDCTKLMDNYLKKCFSKLTQKEILTYLSSKQRPDDKALLEFRILYHDLFKKMTGPRVYNLLVDAFGDKDSLILFISNDFYERFNLVMMKMNVEV